MKKNNIVQFGSILVLFLVVIFSSCTKELDQLGCVSGKPYYGAKYYYVGPMFKRDFYLYLDSPDYKNKNGELIMYEMRWKKIEKQTDCPGN